MPRCGSGSVPIAIGWKCTNCRRTHRSSIPRSAFGNTRARPELTTGTSQPPRNWSAPCHGSSERCNSILNRSDPICFLFADRDVPLLMRGCIIGCGLRRGELLSLAMDSIQVREEHWVIADLKGKAGHIRTVPVPQWVKAAVDVWSAAAGITEGTVFRSINKSGRVWGDGMTPKVLWEVVKEAA